MVKCPECGEEFDSERGMKIHKSRVHKEENQEKESMEELEQELEQKQEKWYNKWKEEVAIVTVVGIIALLSLTIVAITSINRLDREIRDISEKIENETTEDPEELINETNGDIPIEDLYRPSEDTLYLICDFEEEPLRDICVNNHLMADDVTGQETYNYRFDFRTEKGIEIMAGVGTGDLPLWVYNTEKTPEEEYCYMTGIADQERLEEFIEECEETGKYQ